MPRPRAPARLYRRPDTDEWVIRDGTRMFGTGARGDSGRDAAEQALRRYIASRAPERRGPARPDEITVGEVLAAYAQHSRESVAAPASMAYAIRGLAPFWGGLHVSDVKGETCRAYVRERAKPRQDAAGRSRSASAATARRDLGVLQAALNFAAREGLLTQPVLVALPPASPPRDRSLSRSEAARLLRAASPHLRRFILIALATGRRAEAILSLRWFPAFDGGHVDLASGVICFDPAGRRETKKRRGSVRMPRQLAAHMHRWFDAGPGVAVITWRGGRVAEIDTAFRAAVRRAGLGPDVTPHTLKHTAVTWAFQRGMTLEDAADWFATTPDTLMRVYRKHSPEHQSRAKAVMERGKL
jgi:integrase